MKYQTEWNNNLNYDDPNVIAYLREKFIGKINSTKSRFDKLGNKIHFLLSFEEWCCVWKSSGKLPNRNWVLSRKNDVGHYEIGNVYVNHNIQNSTECLTSNSDLEQKITLYAIRSGYKRSIVKRLIKQGKLEL